VWKIPKSPVQRVGVTGEIAFDASRLNGFWENSKSDPTSEHEKGGVGEDWYGV
jgi:hypothetical protein